MLPEYLFDSFIEIHNFAMGLSIGLIVVVLRRWDAPRLAALVLCLATLAALIAWSDTWRLHAWYGIVPVAVLVATDAVIDSR